LIPSENDKEDYLDKIKKRWDSALLSDDENKNLWDNTWMIAKNNNKKPLKQRTDKKTNGSL
jgi:hypothetical protein